MVTLSFKENYYDSSLFTLLVDDYLIYQSEFQRIIDCMSHEFAVQDMDNLSFFLGVQVHKFKDGLHSPNNNTW